MHLLVGRHLDLPVALGLVRVVLGEVGTLDGDLVQEVRISRVAKSIKKDLLSISKAGLSVLAAQGFNLILGEKSLLGVPRICCLNGINENHKLFFWVFDSYCNGSEEDEELHQENPSTSL